MSIFDVHPIQSQRKRVFTPFLQKSLQIIFIVIFALSLFGVPVHQVKAASLSYIGDIGTNSIKDSSTTALTITTSTGVTAGDAIILAYATDPSQDIELVVSDSAGNTYQQTSMAISSGNMRLYTFAAFNVTALPSGSSITVTQTVYSSTAVTARALTASVFRGLAPSGALDQSTGASGSGTSPSSGAVTTTQDTELLVGAIGTKGPSGDTDGSWSNSFTEGPRVGTTGGTDTTNETVTLGYELVTSAGSYTAAKSGITSRTWTATISTYKTTSTGISFIRDLGRAQSNSAGTSLALTTTSAVTGGDDIMVSFAADPAGTVSSVTDTAGNTYTQAVTVTNSSNVATSIFIATNVTAMASGSSITVNHASITARAMVASEFRGLAISGALDQTHTNTGSSTSPSSGATSTTSQASELLVGAIGTEGPNVDAPNIWQNTFTTGPRIGTDYGASSGTDADITIASGWRIVNATGAYTAQLNTLNTSRDWAAGIATFEAAGTTTNYTLTVGNDGHGSVTLSPTGGTYAAGTTVTLTPVANTGYQFDHWSGTNSGDVSSSGGTYTIVMTGNKSITANFVAVTTYTLTTQNDGHGSVTLSPTGGTYNSGTTVTLTPVPNTGYQFSSWSGTNSTDVVDSSGVYTIVMNGNKTVKANFTAIPTYTLTVGNDGHGSVTLSPTGGTYNSGTTVTLTPVPNSGYIFDHWSGTNASNVVDTAGIYTITMDASKSITANFSTNAISHVSDIGSNSIKDSSTASLVVTTTSSVTAGNDIIIAYATDPSQDIELSVTDTVGNTYQQTALAINSGELRTYIFAAYNVNALPSGDTITITQTVYSSTAVSARVAVVSVFSGLAPAGALDQTSASSGNTASPSSGDVITTQNNELLIGAVGTKGAVSDTAGTWSNSFTEGPRAGTSESSGNETVSMGYQIVTASGDYTAAKTGITSEYWAAAIAAFKTSATGISYIGNIGLAQSKTSGTSLAITTTNAVAAGDDILVSYAADTAGTVSSVTDSAGNTYNKVVDVTNSNGVLTNIFAAYNVTTLPASSTITITHSTATARAAVASEFRGLAASGALDQTQTNTGSSTTPSSGATSTTTVASELLIGAVGTEGPYVDAPGMWANAFTFGPRYGTSFGSSSGDDTDVTTALGWKIVNATGAYTAAIQSFSTSRDWAAGIATFKASGTVTNYTLTANNDGHGSVTLSPTGGTYASGTTVTLTPVPNSGYQFSSWSGTDSGSIINTSGVYTIVMNGNKTVQANFSTISTYTLTAGNDGHGTVTLSPTGGTYASGTTVTLTPVPNSGYQFSSWSGTNSGSIINTSGVYTIVMNANKTVQANFSQIMYTLTANNDGHGSVTLSPTGGSYASGTTVTLTPVPNSGYQFSSWSGTDSGSIINTSGVYTIVMNANKTVQANFSVVVTNYTLTAGNDGHGTVTLSPTGGTYASGTTVTLTPVPSSGYQFSSWSGTDSGSIINTSGVYTIVMNGNKTVQANFSAVVTNYTLTAGNDGHGTVTLSPTGGTYASGTTVTLTPVPNSGYKFNNWSGTDSGSIVNTSGVYTIVMNGNKTVQANFIAYSSVSLLTGWNLVSFNIHPTSTAIADVLAGISGDYDLVYGWDASGTNSGSGNWIKYNPSVGYGNTLSTLDETMGFWIHMTTPATLTVTGTQPTLTNTSLLTGAGGWNLVGYASSTSGDLPAILSSHGISNFTLVYAYHLSDTSDPWKMYNASGPGYNNDLTSMSAGWGYWVNVGAGGTWSIGFVTP